MIQPDLSDFKYFKLPHKKQFVELEHVEQSEITLLHRMHYKSDGFELSG